MIEKEIECRSEKIRLEMRSKYTEITRGKKLALTSSPHLLIRNQTLSSLVINPSKTRNRSLEKEKQSDKCKRRDSF